MSGVLVVGEQREGKLNSLSLEALAFAQRLGAMLQLPVSAAVLGSASDAEGAATGLAGSQVERVWALADDLLQQYTADGYVIALQQLINKLQPVYVVFPHTYQVRDFAPALATRYGEVLISDVIGIHEGPVFVRQLMQGKLNADYRHTGSGPGFVSVQAGSFRASDLIAGSTPAAIERLAAALSAGQIRNQPGERFRESTQTVDLSSAPVIVSVGRGIREEENIAIVQELADALGAELAASRPICDSGWLPMERQVGSSGQTVAPKLYLAVGISGAIQHLVGMKGSKTVIAINKDENAPIFEVADYGVVGDLFEIVPALTKAVAAARS